MKICQICGNMLNDNDKKCPNCKEKSKDAIVIDDSNLSEIEEIISSIKENNLNKLYKNRKKNKVWLTVIGISLLCIIISVIGIAFTDDNSNTNTSSNVATTENVNAEVIQKTPIVVTVGQLINELNNNALNASNSYKGQYVELTGKLSSIDSSGEYISLSPLDDDYSLYAVMCYIKEEHLETVSKLEIGQLVTVTGTITDVGEVMGYSLDVDTIK